MLSCNAPLFVTHGLHGHGLLQLLSDSELAMRLLFVVPHVHPLARFLRVWVLDR